MFTDDEDEAFADYDFSQAPFLETPRKTGSRKTSISDCTTERTESQSRTKHSLRRSTRRAQLSDTSQSTNEDAVAAMQESTTTSGAVPMEECCFCGKKFPLDELEAHVNAELDTLEQADKDVTSSASATREAQRKIQEPGDSELWNNSIFIDDNDDDDDESNDIGFDLQPEDWNVLSQQLAAAAPRPAGHVLGNTEGAVVHQTNIVASAVSDEDRLSPIQGLVNLHEARQRFPEVEGYFKQFSSADATQESEMPTFTTASAVRQTKARHNASQVGQRRAARTATGSQSRGRGGSGRGRRGNRRRNAGPSTRGGGDDEAPAYNYYASEPLEEFGMGGMHWEGQGAINYGQWGQDD